jgi:DinB family protein
MNATDVLRYGQLTFLSGLDRLPESEWESPGVCGYWSVKQIIAHIASYEAVLADILKSFTGSGPTPALDRFLGNNVAFNDDEVAARSNLSPSETLEELRAEHERVMGLLDAIPVETLRSTGTMPWYGDEYSIEDLMVYQYYGHKREHVAQIWVFRDHLAG